VTACFPSSSEINSEWRQASTVPWFHVVHRDNFAFKCCYSILCLSQIQSSLLACADSSVTHSPLTFLRLRAVNDSSFELLYRSLQVTVRSFKANDFCFFVIFYSFRFLERITSALYFEQPFLEVLYSNCFC